MVCHEPYPKSRKNTLRLPSARKNRPRNHGPAIKKPQAEYIKGDKKKTTVTSTATKRRTGRLAPPKTTTVKLRTLRAHG
ncbi:hypothetical protein RSSM_00464 [Rhodopirellula sallentina SM41]|uniref:Uncharacterized protein n=1 Tax=Rhodopirellula sallentina SM41 TaxID=1263870 RepID=M5U9V7_9BACT|nr:hypothetical protein RSSM_00464 [Rhodopirellula sallentina SM41]